MRWSKLKGPYCWMPSSPMLHVGSAGTSGTCGSICSTANIMCHAVGKAFLQGRMASTAPYSGA